jgi:hypothetical protein
MVMRWPTTGPTDGEAGYFYRTGLSNLTPEDLRVPVPPAPVCPQGASLPPLRRRSNRPVNEARCSNELLEHLEHLHETNDLFGNVAK